uniref:Ground-like domain-containing protein n=1 Tax=Meloidogyne javanica TaxID=6303 RepID=A0A915N7P7_MELJA
MMCCNSKLEDVMRDAYKELLQEKGEDIFHRSNLQKITNRVQALTEAKFNTTFEVITAISDFASKKEFVVKPIKHSNTLTKSVSEEVESEESKEEEKEEGESKEEEKEESLEQSNNLKNNF